MYPQIFGKYVLEKELATGGMARVLLATLRGAGGFEKKLVVKQIRDELAIDHEFVQRFVEEAKTTVALSHPNIVPVYELGIEMGTYYLAMELVDGVSVDQLLTRAESGAKLGLSPEEGAYIGVEVCRALDYAHRRMQVVHRDITPRNVMVDEEGQVKIIDFGIAARASVAGQDVFGTPGHMAPEQLRREEIGPPTDIFAVAVLLMELWSGSPPFRRKTPVESLAQMHAPHPKPSGVDARLSPLDSIMARAMALAKADRPQQADDLGRVLRKFLADTDSGDIERKLGARVRDARATAALAAKKRKRGDSLVKPSRPSIPDMGPRTFAVRAEVGDWRPDGRREGPDEGDGSGTRRLPPSQNPPPPEPLATLDPPVEPEPPKIETVATRPIETPIGLPPPENRAPKRGRWIALAAAALLSTLGVSMWGAMKAAGNPASAPDPMAHPAVASRDTETQERPASPPRPTPPPTAIPFAATGSSTTNASPPRIERDGGSGGYASTDVGALVPQAKQGSLVLIGDPPGIQVDVDGRGARRCPVVLFLPSGAHKVDFTFLDTGETVGKQVDVPAGAELRVRADFTGARPLIR
jgi:eukaryotic-like serine/threonine-protein kinase